MLGCGVQTSLHPLDLSRPSPSPPTLHEEQTNNPLAPRRMGSLLGRRASLLLLARGSKAHLRRLRRGPRKHKALWVPLTLSDQEQAARRQGNVTRGHKATTRTQRLPGGRTITPPSRQGSREPGQHPSQRQDLTLKRRKAANQQERLCSSSVQKRHYTASRTRIEEMGQGWPPAGGGIASPSFPGTKTL